jgi:DNA-binding transcriptional regulator LsrR (DeoR family)
MIWQMAEARPPLDARDARPPDGDAPARAERRAPGDAADTRLDDAARAGWLYYIAGKTQDDIARALNVSRPTAQRLVSLCRSERLITFQMEHPIRECMSLAAQLTDRFELTQCDVVPTDGAVDTSFVAVAEAAAIIIERLLRSNRAAVIAVGTGRSMRASVERVTPMSRPLHRLVSLVGNISPDGSASPFDALTKLAELTQAQYFPMPVPMHASTANQRKLLLEIASVQRIFAMASAADVWLTGIGQIDQDAILYRDGFITRDELLQLIRAGGVGEILGWVFDAKGRFLETGTNTRVTSIRPNVDGRQPRICIAHGATKVGPLRAALAVHLVNGLVTDEATARALLDA